MSNEIIIQMACPNCLSPIDVREHGRHVVCESCNSQFILQGHLCPSCKTFSRERRGFCGSCGTALERTCRKCETANWAGDEYCVQCGNALDLLDYLAHHDQQEHQRHRTEYNTAVRQARAQSAKLSKERRAQWEDERRAEVPTLGRRAKQRQQKQFWLVLGLGTTILLLFIFALAIYALSISR